MQHARLLIFGSVLLAGCLPGSGAQAQQGKAILKDVKGSEVGQADLTQTPRGVLIRLNLKHIPAGEHAFHIHEVGKCDPPFTSAGGHFNPTKHKHGLLSSDGAHAGDMPNLHVPSDGTLTFEAVNSAVTLQKGQPNSLLREGGTALVIHLGKDDYKTDPTGDAGGRIACGVVE